MENAPRTLVNGAIFCQKINAMTPFVQSRFIDRTRPFDQAV